MGTPTYLDWAAQYPQAAVALLAVLTAPIPPGGTGSEARAQQDVRLSVAQQGGYAFRNNVGATKSRCPDCGAPQSVLRFGLANDSTALNKRIKSSDLILAIPRTVTQAMVGSTMAQFGAVECKRPGWTYKGTEREAGQAAWLALIARAGGYATFSTGEVVL